MREITANLYQKGNKEEKLQPNRLLAVPFQSVERASESRKQAQENWSERASQGETGGEAGGKGTALSSVTDGFEFPATSEMENLDWFTDNRKLSGQFDKY